MILKKRDSGIIEVSLDVVEKPLEIFYEQIAARVATGLAAVETRSEISAESFMRSFIMNWST